MLVKSQTESKTTPTSRTRMASPTTPVRLEKPRAAAVAPAKRSRPMSRAMLAAMVFVVVLAASLFLYTRPPAAALAEHSADAPSEMTTVVAAPGLVESASGLRQLGFDVPGKLKSVAVNEGDRVKAGQLVAELENAPLAARVEMAKAELAGARSRASIRERSLKSDAVRAKQTVLQLKQELALAIAGPRGEQVTAARAQLALAEAEAKGAEETRQRYYDPTDKYEAWSKQLYSQAETQSHAANARVELALARLQELTAGTRPEEIDRAKAKLAEAQAASDCLEANLAQELDAARSDVEQSQARVNVAEAELHRTRLYAPIDGTVIWKFMHAGEAIDAVQQQAVIAIADQTHLRVRALVDEGDYASLKPGQHVRVTAEAFPGRTFKGHVELLCASAGEKPFSTGEAHERHDVRVVNVLVALDGEAPLKLGLRVRTYFQNDK